MSEQNKRIEDAFNEVLTDEVLKNALDFAGFLGANGIVQTDKYAMHYMGECVCYIDTRNESHSWIVWVAGDYSSENNDFPIDERTKEIAWAHVNKCGYCEGVDCKPGKTRMIFGKEFTNICCGANDIDLYFSNPDAETLESMKKLVLMRKNIIAGYTK